MAKRLSTMLPINLQHSCPQRCCRFGNDAGVFVASSATELPPYPLSELITVEQEPFRDKRRPP